MTGSHQSASGPSASTNRRRMSANAPIFGPDRQVAGDRRRRALVRVRRPVVERDRGDLERDAGRQEREAHRQARPTAARCRRRSRRAPGRRPADRVGLLSVVPVRPHTNASPNRKIAELNEPEQEVLDRALGRVRVGLVVAGQQVARQHHQLEAEEQQQQVGRAGEEHRAAHREDEHDRELGDRQARAAAGSRARTGSSSRRSR